MVKIAISSTMLSLAILLSFGVAGPERAAADQAPFFKGQTITIIVGSDPGGGYDGYAQPISRHLGALIPGHPSVVLKYMPGAASIVAANYLYSTAPRDGTVIGAVQRQIPFEPLRGDAAARYDPLRMHWLGSVTAETSVFIVWKTAPQRTARDLLTMPLIAASLGTGTDSEVETIAMKRLLGAPIKLISGYQGTPDALLALQRGEVQGIHGISWSYLKTKKADWLRDGTIRLLLQSGLHRNPELKNIPSIYDLVSSPDDRKVWDLILAPKVMSRPYVVPPGIPSDRLAILDAAFARLMKDPGFLADMSRLKLEVIPTTGTEIQDLIRSAYASPPAIVGRMREAISTTGQ